MPFDPYRPRVHALDKFTARWCLEPAGRPDNGARRALPRRFFAHEDTDGLRAAFRAAEAAGNRPTITLCERVIPGNGRSPRSYATWVHVSWVGHDIAGLPHGACNRVRPGSPEAAEEARLDAEWEAEQAVLAAATA